MRGWNPGWTQGQYLDINKAYLYDQLFACQIHIVEIPSKHVSNNFPVVNIVVKIRYFLLDSETGVGLNVSSRPEW